MRLKALEILKSFKNPIGLRTAMVGYSNTKNIYEAIKELEKLDSKKCSNCVTYIKEPNFFSFKCNILCINPHENFSCSEHKYKEE